MTHRGAAGDDSDYSDDERPFIFQNIPLPDVIQTGESVPLVDMSSSHHSSAAVASENSPLLSHHDETLSTSATNRMDMHIPSRRLHENVFPEDPDFSLLIHEAEVAIENGVTPERVVQGSSGSYFVKNTDGKILGMFHWLTGTIKVGFQQKDVAYFSGKKFFDSV